MIKLRPRNGTQNPSILLQNESYASNKRAYNIGTDSGSVCAYRHTIDLRIAINNVPKIPQSRDEFAHVSVIVCKGYGLHGYTCIRLVSALWVVNLILSCIISYLKVTSESFLGKCNSIALFTVRVMYYISEGSQKKSAIAADEKGLSARFTGVGFIEIFSTFNAPASPKSQINSLEIECSRSLLLLCSSFCKHQIRKEEDS